jgi:ubiquinone/menaquinone biosynthesis C-methylase UbiE
MSEKTLSPHSARRIYDLIGRAYDLAAPFEGKAQQLGRDQLDLGPGLRVLEAGTGTGREHRALASAVAPGGMAVALDLSFVMARLTRRRSGSPACQADAGWLPFADGCFDRVFAAYVLDLMASAALPGVMRQFHRILRPGGRLVIVAMTEGVTLSSRAFVALWKAVYAVSPRLCAGCRPIQLAGIASQAGFVNVQAQVEVQWAVPSEVLLAVRP